jgi:hypothetical protein
MWRKFWTIAAAFLFIASVSSVATAQGKSNSRQRTPDGATPAEESICDDLKHGTPGLFGLCIAFCEAHDCEPDFSLEDPFSVCKKSDRKILDKYRRKMRDGDPDMPCLPNPNGPGNGGETLCPCWSEDDLQYFQYQPGFADILEHWLECGTDIVINRSDCSQELNFISETSVLTGNNLFVFEIEATSGNCADGTFCSGYFGCVGETCPSDLAFRGMSLAITADEFAACKEQIGQLTLYCD